MSSGNISLDERVEALEKEVRALSARVRALSGDAPEPRAPLEALEQEGRQDLDVSEEMLTWAGARSLFPRLAALCFLLVVALILRTLTESGVLGHQVGAVTGMAYAVFLVCTSWFLYHRQNALAPVCAGTGTVLLGVIVVETHARFHALPAIPAYLLVMSIGAVAAAISYRYDAPTPVTFGTLGMCLAGAAIDYPNPFFAYVAALLVTANAFGFFAATISGTLWLRWILLAVTLLMYHLWALKLGMTVAAGDLPSANLAAGWFFPMLVVMMTVYLVLGYASTRRRRQRATVFDAVMLASSAGGGFAAAAYVAYTYRADLTTVGIAGLVTALLHLAVAADLARRRYPAGAGSAAFSFPAVLLAGLSLWLITGDPVVVTAVLAVLAWVLAAASTRWGSGGVRVISYATAAGVLFTNLTMVNVRGGGAETAVAAVSAAVAGGCFLMLYRWCRHFPAPDDSRYFMRLDRRDFAAVATLAAALSSLFLFFRGGSLYLLQVLQMFTSDRFVAAQTVIINGGAGILMCLAYRKRDSELRNVALLVTLIGGAKVFLYDFTHIHGAGLVASVFSFGVVAAAESLFLGRWRGPGESGKETPASC